MSRVRVIVKYPGCTAEVMDIEPTPAAVSRLLGPSWEPLFSVINRYGDVLHMYASTEPGEGARVNLGHPGAPGVPVYGPIVWMEGTADGHPRSIRDDGVPAILDLIAAISPATDREVTVS